MIARSAPGWLASTSVVLGLLAALLASCSGEDAVQVRAESDETPTASGACVPGVVATVSLLVMSGSTPADNENLLVAMMEVVNDEQFAAELLSGLDEDISKRFDADALTTAISATRPPHSAAFEVAVQTSAASDAELIAESVLPTLQEILARVPQDGAIVEHIPGPLVQELFDKPEITQVNC